MQEVFEIWKDIQGYEGHYQVSSKGNVRSLDRYIECRGTYRFQKGKTLKPYINKFGYRQVILYDKNGYKLHRINRLVAQSFIPNPNNLPQVNHKDEDKSNNRVSNLEWMTLKRNINYGTRNKRMTLTKGKNVKAFDDDGNFIMWFCSMAVAEKITGINQGDISRCTLGKTEHAGGYVWKIVKQGGVADDACEWTLDGVYLHSPHKPLVSCVTDENYRYYYCPVCGKKIKVVE